MSSAHRKSEPTFAADSCTGWKRLILRNAVSKESEPERLGGFQAAVQQELLKFSAETGKSSHLAKHAPPRGNRRDLNGNKRTSRSPGPGDTVGFSRHILFSDWWHRRVAPSPSRPIPWPERRCQLTAGDGGERKHISRQHFSFSSKAANQNGARL